MANITTKKIREHKVTKAIMKALPWVILTGIGIVYYTRTRGQVEDNFIIEDFWMRSTIRTRRQGSKVGIEGDEGLDSPSPFLFGSHNLHTL